MVPGLRAAALCVSGLLATTILSVPVSAAPAGPKADRYTATEDVALVVKAPGVLKNDRPRAKVRRLVVQQDQ